MNSIQAVLNNIVFQMLFCNVKPPAKARLDVDFGNELRDIPQVTLIKGCQHMPMFQVLHRANGSKSKLY